MNRLKQAYKNFISETGMHTALAHKEKAALSLAQSILPALVKPSNLSRKQQKDPTAAAVSATAVFEYEGVQDGELMSTFLRSNGLLLKRSVSYDDQTGATILGEHRPIALISQAGYAGHVVARTDSRGVPLDRVMMTPERTDLFLDEVIALLTRISQTSAKPEL